MLTRKQIKDFDRIDNQTLIALISSRLETMTERQLDRLQTDITFVLWDLHEVQTYIEKNE